MKVTRRSAVMGTLALPIAMQPLVGCSAAATYPPGTTRVYVMGMIHSGHLDSEAYSLQVLEAAVRKANPDVVLSEIPPDRINRAVRTFRETGAVDEPRTQVFPEYTDVIFPLSREMGFRIFGTAGWTREIADNRARALEQIRNDPARAVEWGEHQAALRQFQRDVAGRRDDPKFIHTAEYDAIVEASRTPYQRYFDDDLGPGGWTQINRSHTNLINSALDTINGEGLTALVTFGAAHKYLILRSLQQRDDVEILDTASLFA